ncbi:MAG: glucosylceramidase, partial [Pirellulaceae bacterium]|nr:glucosylceramidase [Pirellulaceae bacterium]
HDRYSAAKRNPYNEIECSDHYARAMASYGVFQAACGFNCHGPKGRIEFAPRLSPENFKAAMVTAEGWGSYSQQSTPADFRAEIEIKHGRLRLKTLVVAPAGAVSAVQADLDGQPLAATVARQDGRAIVTFADAVVVSEGQRLQVRI